MAKSTLWQNRLSGLELDDIARGVFLPLRVGERHTYSVPRARDQPACAPSGDYLIANSPFRHLQEPWHDAAPLRSPRLCPDPPPPPADLAGRRSRCALGQPECRVLRPRRRPGEGPVKEPIAAAQPRQRPPLFMPPARARRGEPYLTHA